MANNWTSSFRGALYPQRSQAESEERNESAPPPEPSAQQGVPPSMTNNQHVMPQGAKLPPADGLRAWSVCFASFAAGFIALGWCYSQGSFLPSLLIEFHDTLTTTSLVATMVFVFFFVGGLFAGPLSARFGVKQLVLFGSAVWVVGVVLGSYAQAVWHSILTQGVMTGLGASFIYWPSLAVVPAWFIKYRGSAMGAAVLGSSFGLLAMSFGGQALIDAYGWRTTMRIFAGVGAAILLVTLLLIERRTPAARGQGLFTVTWQLIKLRNFQLFLVAVFFFQFCFFIPYLFLPSYAAAHGLDGGAQSLCLSMLGIGSSVGRITLGPLADYLKNRMFVYRLSTFLGAVMLAVWPVCTSLSSMLAFAFIYGFSGGGVAALFTAVAADLWGPEKLGGVIPAISVISIPGAFAASPLFSLIVTQTTPAGATELYYNSAIWFTCGCLCASLHAAHAD